MARVTVEDCILKVPNRFDLVLYAAHRARGIAAGEPLTMERDNDKNPVVALREIADETIDLEKLDQSVIQGLQKHMEVDEPEEDSLSLTLPTLEWAEGESPAVDAAKADEADEAGEQAAEPESEPVSEPVSEKDADGS